MSESKDPKVGLWDTAKALPSGQQLTLIGIATAVFAGGTWAGHGLSGYRVDKAIAERTHVEIQLDQIKNQDSSQPRYEIRPAPPVYGSS